MLTIGFKNLIIFIVILVDQCAQLLKSKDNNNKKTNQFMGAYHKKNMNY